MKKVIYFTNLLVILITGASVLAWDTPNYPSEFITSLENCKNYTYKIGPMETFGMMTTTKKQILGKENGYCNYVETINYETGNHVENYESGQYVIKCKFNESQISRLTNAMKNPVNTGKPISISFGANNERKISGGDSASRIWTEYMNDSNVCTTTSR